MRSVKMRWILGILFAASVLAFAGASGRFPRSIGGWLANEQGPDNGCPLALGSRLNGLLVGYADTKTSSEQPATVLPVETITVDPASSYLSTRTYTGTVAARRMSRLGFQRSGELTALDVDEGEQVAAGQTLGRLDTRHLDAKKQQAEAQKAQASAVLKELIAGPREETIATAEANVKHIQSQLDQQKSSVERMEQLMRRRGVSTEAYEGANQAVANLETQLVVVTKQLEELQAGARPERIEAQQAAVSQIDAALASIAHEFEDSELVAPYDGTVSRRFVDEGTVVSAGTPIVELLEHDWLEAWVGLPADLAAAFDVGQVHTIRAGSRSHRAVVKSVLPYLDATTRTVRVVLEIDGDAAPHVVSGQVIRLPVATREDVQGFWLPTSALVRGARGLWSCYVVVAGSAADQPETVERRDMEIVHTDGKRVLVRGALQAGDRVVHEGTHRIVAGQFVRDLRLAEMHGTNASSSTE